MGLLNLEDRVPWVPQHKTRSRSWRNSVKSQHQQDITRALVDQDFDFCLDDQQADLSHLVKTRPLNSNSVKPNEAEDLSSPASQSLIFYPHPTPHNTPSVDFPFQFNFGSIYSSSLTIYFDN